MDISRASQTHKPHNFLAPGLRKGFGTLVGQTFSGKIRQGPLSCFASPYFWSFPMKAISSGVACAFLFLCVDLCAQGNFGYAGSGTMESAYFTDRADYTTMELSPQLHNAKDEEKQRKKNKELLDVGLVSALDLDAPQKALEQFNIGVGLLKEQRLTDALAHLQKAIKIYPKFASAYVNLGLVYLAQENTAQAQKEFEKCIQLDDKFSRPLVQLGSLEMSRKDFAPAETHLEKASTLTPSNPQILSSLAFAQIQNHHYRQVLETSRKVHSLPHSQAAEVHYLGAVAAKSLNDFETMEQELKLFVSEDPTGPLAAVAHHDLEVIAHNRQVTRQVEAASGIQSGTAPTSSPLQTFPDAERLKRELSGLETETEGDTCGGCDTVASESADSESNTSHNVPADTVETSTSGAGWTIRKSVDEVAQFFAVTDHGRMVTDLSQSNIQIRDDNRPPERVLQFTPQSKLPLLLGLLVDTSGSVQERFSFEKRAAMKFVEKVLSGPSDLGFVAGFSTNTNVTQDFTDDLKALDIGIDALTDKGGTSLFDAVSFACWKLAGYPEHERVAKVLVVLTDGEDNSSHRTLNQSIHDSEATGVTIYTISTNYNGGAKTAADKVLQALAERSGGEAIFPGDISGLGKSLDALRDLIRSRYLIAYRPANFEPNGGYRAIQINAEKNGKHLRVRARKGYYARLEAAHHVSTATSAGGAAGDRTVRPEW